MTVHRAQLRYRLAVARAELLWQLIDLDEETLTQRPVFAGWTAKDVLAHLAARDELFAERLELLLAGWQDEPVHVDVDRRTAPLQAERKGWSLDRALAACLAAQASFLSALARLSDEQLQRPVRFPWGEESVEALALRRSKQDASHARNLQTWRRMEHLKCGVGPKALLLAALKAGRKELLLTTAFVAAGDRETRPLCGAWTLKDVLGHLTDWERVFVDGLRRITEGGTPQVEYGGDLEGWNQAHAEARRNQPWNEVWADLQATRQELLKLLARFDQHALSRPFPSPWNAQDTAYAWVRKCLGHDREHAAGLRAEMRLGS